MAEIVVRFDVRFSRGWVRGLLALVMILAVAPELASESVTLTTYYPAPSGVYTNMIVTGATYLARDGGAVGVQTASITGGYVMDVNGSLLVRSNEQVNGNETINGSLTVNGNETVNGVLTANGGFVANGPVTFNNAIQGTWGLVPGYRGWATVGTGSGGAAIYNDGGSYRTLMIVGNNSGSANRRVGVWDELDINGIEVVSGNLTGNGAYIRAGSNLAVDNASCYSVNVNANGTSPSCPGGSYLTNTSGVYARYISAGSPSYTTSPGAGGPTQVYNTTYGALDALCCPCPAGGCLY